MKFFTLFLGLFLASNSFGVGPTTIGKLGVSTDNRATFTGKGLISREATGTWNPVISGLINLTGSPLITEAAYTILGNIVFYELSIGGLSVTAASSLSIINLTVPIDTTNAIDPIAGVIVVSQGGGAAQDQLGGIVDASSGTSNVALASFRPSSTGATNFRIQGQYILR